MDLQHAEEQMKKAIVKMQAELSSMRTGRAHVSLLENIKAEYYGTLTPINQMANLSVSEGRTIEVKPWDKEGLQLIEQAILKSDLGVTPMNDGKSLRISLPSPNEERRKELVKVVRKHAEDFRIAVRNIRREAVESAKKEEKEKKISADDLRREEQSVQKLTDQYVKNIDEVLAVKEKEIMEV